MIANLRLWCLFKHAYVQYVLAGHGAPLYRKCRRCGNVQQ